MSASKRVRWISSSHKDISDFPSDVRQVMGFGLYLAQTGGKHPDAKPLQGFGGAGVLEMVDDHDGDTYRAVYTVKFDAFVYVLHAFQKKSKKGSATPQVDIETIRRRLKMAEDDYRRRKEEAG